MQIPFVYILPSIEATSFVRLNTEVLELEILNFVTSQVNIPGLGGGVFLG